MFLWRATVGPRSRSGGGVEPRGLDGHEHGQGRVRDAMDRRIRLRPHLGRRCDTRPRVLGRCCLSSRPDDAACCQGLLAGSEWSSSTDRLANASRKGSQRGLVMACLTGRGSRTVLYFRALHSHLFDIEVEGSPDPPAARPRSWRALPHPRAVPEPLFEPHGKRAPIIRRRRKPSCGKRSRSQLASLRNCLL